MPEVTVTATRVEEDSFDLPVAIDRVDRREIREDKPQVNLSESLNVVPGGFHGFNLFPSDISTRFNAAVIDALRDGLAAKS